MPKTRAKPRTQPAKSRVNSREKPPRTRSLHVNFWIYSVLFLATFAVYAQVRRFEFVNYDDPEYVSDNLHVREGITPAGVEWAFTSGEAANWFPLTRLSHMLDAQLFGVRSGFHHLTNALIHALATLLLFAFLNRATHMRWPSAFVAFLFALHPLHVESVAWVAERKDVLSAFFWFLALWSYVRYTERPAFGRYLLALLPFCLGLMAKPMIVTLPFVLLLIDFWPLRRRAAIWEKIPFFALSAAVAIATYLVQRSSGAVKAFTVFPFGLRIENALISYIAYIGKTFWPTRLAVFYPYPLNVPVWKALLAGLLIIGISAVVVRWSRACPYAAVGWFWYLGTLFPVIGLVQVGAQARADRYMYVPLVGIAMILAWGAADLLRTWPTAKKGIVAAAAAACLSCGVVTSVQIQYWRNSGSLFEHALKATGPNYVAQHNLGTYLLDVPGRLPEAVTHLKAALRINPDSVEAHTDLGSALSKIPGRLPEAVAEYNTALRIDPDSAITHNDLGNTLSKMPGGLPQAIVQYQAALRIKPDFAEAHNNLASALFNLDRVPEAIAEYQAALRIDPDYAKARDNLALALSLSNVPDSLPEAIAQYEAVLRIKPDLAEAHYNLAVALLKSRRLPEAIEHLETALRIKPDYAEAHNNLGVALSQIPGRMPEAIQHFQTALRLKPDYPDARENLKIALSNTPGKLPAPHGK